MKNYLSGDDIRTVLAAMDVDEVRRFNRSQHGTVHNQMQDLKQFGENDRKYLFRTIYHQETEQTVVVRLS